MVGRFGGVQPLNLSVASNCLTDKNIHHEMGHAVGLEHEHKRCDRDNYVVYNSSNLVNGSDVTQWNKICSGYGETYDFGFYDYASIMHYTATQGSKRDSSGVFLLVLMAQPKNSSYAGTPASMGTASQLSAGDIAGINKLYP